MLRKVALYVLWGMLLLAAFCLPCPSRAQTNGHILNFHSDITVNLDSSLLVTETIVFRNDDPDPLNGFFRFFRTRNSLGFGLYRNTPMTILGVTNNGVNTPYSAFEKPNGLLLEIGNDATRISRGVVTYTISYHTERQLDYLSDHTELYWHVTGSGWDFPIDQASATIFLPQSMPTARAEGFLRSLGTDIPLGSSPADEHGAFTITISRPLSAHEGFNVLLKFPSGILAQPTVVEERANLIHDNLTLCVGLLCIVLLLLIYTLMWVLFGKDPQPGAVHVSTTPPTRLSPAGLRYLWIERYDPKTFAVALVDLAVNGLIHIKELEDRYIFSLRLESEPALRERLTALEKTRGQTLPVEEEGIARIMFARTQHFTLQYENAPIISAMIKKLETSLRLKCDHVFFMSNRWLLAIGMTVATLFLLYLGYCEVPAVYLGERIRLMIGLTIFGVGLPFLPIIIIRMWHDTFSHFVGRIGNSGLIARYIFIVVLYFAVGAYFIWNASNQLLFVLLLISLLHLLFAHLLKAPTRMGRKILDEIEGFRMYLSGEHPHLVAQVNPLPMTPDLFEKYLPYALAFDMEQQWAAQFAHQFLQSAEDPSSISHWYSGPAWETHNVKKFAVSLHEELAVSLTPITVPMESLPESLVR